jgi:hypothetical protein
MCPTSRRHCAFVVRPEDVEDSPLSIQRSQSAGGVRRRNAEREGSHSSKDGNPLVDGRLTVRCMRRVGWTVERMGDQVAETIVCFGKRVFILGNNKPLFYSVKRVYLN